MLFWVLALTMALLTAAILARPALRGGTEAPAARQDLQVFKAQLAEIDRDTARGLLQPEDAERARTEIARKILEADRRLAATAPGRGAPRWAGWLAAGVTALVIAAGFLLYAEIGAPGYPDLPIAERLRTAERLYATRLPQAEAEKAVPPLARPAADPQMEALMTRLRSAVSERPDDPRGLDLLARNEAALGNFAAAWQAQARLIAAKGAAATAEDQAFQAEAMILAADGAVSPEAEQVLNAALRLNPHNPTARYYLGLMMAQSGRPDRTFPIWRDLLEEGPADAPWIAPIRSAIAELAWVAGDDGYQPPPVAAPVATPEAPAALPGPSQADVAAAGQMAAGDREQMIRGMVESLASRLADQGGTPQEWARLIRALGVLNETERARAIWQEAQQVFAASPEALEEVRAAAEEAGVAG